MRKSIQVLLGLFIVVSLLVGNVCADSQAHNESPIYPVLPGSEEWNELGTVENKIEACRIPADILASMSDNELVQAIIDYPFVIDVFLVDDYRDAVDSLIANCDALNELLNRGTAKEAILGVLNQRYQYADANGCSGLEELQNDALCIIVACIPDCCSRLSSSEADLINSHTYMIQLSQRQDETRGYVYTPNGTAVYYTNPSCSHSDPNYHSSLDSQLVSTYGVYLISSGTCKYNCHSYAWYSTSTSNTKWIPNPSPYMTDNSYSIYCSGLNISSSNVQMNYRVSYGSSTASAPHSAKISDNNTGVVLKYRYCKSKWGKAGVFEHMLQNVPSSYWNNGQTANAWG